MRLAYRDHVMPADRDTVKDIVESTGFFHTEEVDIAVEIVDERLEKGEPSGYHFLFCENGDADVLGYTCFGPIPGTEKSFDLYWIAVHRQYQGRGIGRGLLGRSEDVIKSKGGSRIYIETSSRELYRPTQAFYTASGYIQEAVLQDFYSPGDSKIIYVKAVG